MSTIVETAPAPVAKDELTLNREAALAWAQEMGYEGRGLPKGTPFDGSSCALAVALGGRVGTVEWYPPTGKGGWIELPPRVRKFTVDFDCGLHPDLIAR